MSAPAQNSPPKPETDCGVTAVCQPPPHAAHPQAVWPAELLVVAFVVLAAFVTYRLLTRRGTAG